ncbi:hypothetical protein MAM1_0754c11197, partial [Mucor ambiguus]
IHNIVVDYDSELGRLTSTEVKRRSENHLNWEKAHAGRNKWRRPTW